MSSLERNPRLHRYQYRISSLNWFQTKCRSYVKVTEKLRTQPIHISNTLCDLVKLFFWPLKLPQEPVYRRPRTSQYTGDHHLTAASSKLAIIMVGIQLLCIFLTDECVRLRQYIIGFEKRVYRLDNHR